MTTPCVDDVTLLYRVPYDPCREVSLVDRRWTKAAHGLDVQLQADAGVLAIDLSLPKFVGGADVNFPLVSAVTPCNVGPLVSAVAGVPVPDVGGMACWSIAYTLDVRVQDPRRVIHGAKDLNRKRDRKGSRAWDGDDLGTCDATETCVRWTSKGGTEISLYDKAHELRAHGHDVGDADGVLRVTVTPRGSKAILQCVAGIAAGHLPTLATMLRPDVVGYVMSKNVRRLRLPEALDDASLADRGWSLLYDKYDRERAAALWNALGAWRDGYTVKGAARMVGVSEKTVRRHRDILLGLHLAPSDDPAATRDATEELRRVLAPFLEVRAMPHVEAEGSVRSPYAAARRDRRDEYDVNNERDLAERPLFTPLDATPPQPKAPAWNMSRTREMLQHAHAKANVANAEAAEAEGMEAEAAQ